MGDDFITTCVAKGTNDTCLNQKHLTTGYGSIPGNTNKIIRDFARSHIESFNCMLAEGLTQAVKDISPVEFEMSHASNLTRVSLFFKDATIGFPAVSATRGIGNLQLFPSECRQRKTTYKGKFTVTLNWSINGEIQPMIEVSIGEVPVMVMSNCCYLSGMKPKQLVQHGEEPQEFGGYFIINGLEKVMRMLIVQRRNYPLCNIRMKWRTRGKLFSEYGVMLRSVKAEHAVSNVVLHYLTNGTAKLMFLHSKEMFFIPVVLLLKALVDYTDRQIFQELVRGKENDSYYKGCITNMLRQVQDEGILSSKHALAYIGEKFRGRIRLPDWFSKEQVANFFLKQCLCIHLESNVDKFNLLVFMTKKLFAFVNGECAVESVDSAMNQELLLSGNLYMLAIKDKLKSWLLSLRNVIETKITSTGPGCKLTSKNMLHAIQLNKTVTHFMEYFLATGNFVPRDSGASLQQTAGFTIVADNLNYLRYISHFRAVHRGAFFVEMRTTVSRKLLPESWGFLCPVHTPDGTPCGLLNHLAALCEVVVYQAQTSHLSAVLCSFGMTPFDVPFRNCGDAYTVMLDGQILGYVSEDLSKHVVSKLRFLKAAGDFRVPMYMEICLVPITNNASQYPGIFLFTTPSRMMRPVQNLSTKTKEYIGSFEQVYLNVAVTAKEILSEITTHLELHETGILSILANLIPMPDFNQSPRNMYQCQMAKQTMGSTPYTLKYRCDNKMYRLLTPQSPLFRSLTYDVCQIDDYPLGTNAIVAVISYTGYDMEDAMIINKGSFQRGFAFGAIYKNEIIDLMGRNRVVTKYFGRYDENHYLDNRLGLDGLPPVGISMRHGDPFYSTISATNGEMTVTTYLSLENAIVEDVVLLGSDSGLPLQKVCIQLRIQRNPTIGDKFASRHGQKGICSQLWPQENMPFTESGMTPDIIFNPHGFPSRMTIGMMIESMAGKSAALHGLVHNATPFQFSEKDSAVEYFGKMLERAGYNYYGVERMYSGVDGRELNADIFFGVVYYQRLRHMVADKYQVRTTGPVDTITKQPIKGRKRAGGIRFGEMERDSLLAHGVSFLLHDRLFNCSDKSLDYVCTKCGGLVSPILLPPKHCFFRDMPRVWTCSVCETGKYIQTVYLPYVFHYLVVELASVNIRTVLDVN